MTLSWVNPTDPDLKGVMIRYRTDDVFPTSKSDGQFGTGFGTQQGTGSVTFGGINASLSAWSDTSITVAVPFDAKSGPVVITVSGVQSSGINFKVNRKLPPPGEVHKK